MLIYPYTMLEHRYYPHEQQTKYSFSVIAICRLIHICLRFPAKSILVKECIVMNMSTLAYLAVNMAELYLILEWICRWFGVCEGLRS